MLRLNMESWKEYDQKLAARIHRTDRLGAALIAKVFGELQNFVENTLFIGRISHREQVRFFRDTGTGYYGHGSHVERHIINPQEKLGGVDIPGKMGPHFLQSLHGKDRFEGGTSGIHAIDILTLATMTPYRQDARSGGGKTGEQPIMVYFREGWSTPDGRYKMDPRLGAPGMEVAKYLHDAGYEVGIGIQILHWVITGAN